MFSRDPIQCDPEIKVQSLSLGSEYFRFPGEAHSGAECSTTWTTEKADICDSVPPWCADTCCFLTCDRERGCVRGYIDTQEMRGNRGGGKRERERGSAALSSLLDPLTESLLVHHKDKWDMMMGMKSFTCARSLCWLPFDPTRSLYWFLIISLIKPLLLSSPLLFSPLLSPAPGYQMKAGSGRRPPKGRTDRESHFIVFLSLV